MRLENVTICAKIGEARTVYHHGARFSAHDAERSRDAMPSDKFIPFGHCQCGCGQLAPIAQRTDSKRGFVRGMPHRFVLGHGNSLRNNAEAYAKNFWGMVSVGGPEDCWAWNGCVSDSGYGRAQFKGHLRHATRVAYTISVGEIPAGMVLDHLCRNRICVNPAHLRVCTPKENTLAPGSLSPSALNAARTHCKRGHPLFNYQGARRCKPCTDAINAAYRARVSAARRQGRPSGPQTHCKRGHELSPENVRITSRGSRECRQCTRWRNREAMVAARRAHDLVRSAIA